MMKCDKNLHGLHIREGVESIFIDVSFEWNRTFNGSDYWSYVADMVRYSLKDFQDQSIVDMHKSHLQSLNRKCM